MTPVTNEILMTVTSISGVLIMLLLTVLWYLIMKFIKSVDLLNATVTEIKLVVAKQGEKMNNFETHIKDSHSIIQKLDKRINDTEKDVILIKASNEAK